LPTIKDGVVSFLDLFKIVKDKIGEVDAAVWEAFIVFDTSRRGFIDASQIRSAFEKLKEPITLKDAIGLAKSADLDKDNRIDIYEFQKTILPALSAAVRKNTEILAQKARDDLAALEKFRMFDTDKNGVVSVDELQAVFLRLGYSLDGAIDTSWDMMRAIDTNLDGKATLTEIKKA
jgi:Ca2+-binding EF-hand superfamily protein